MGQTGSRRLRKSDSTTSTELTRETEISSQSVIKTAFIMIGHPEQQNTAMSLRLSLENSEGGRVTVYDLEDVEKSVGVSNDEKLGRYLNDSTGVVLLLSDALKDCIDHETTVEVTINQTKFMLNGAVVSRFLQDEKLKRKFIPLSSSKDKLPKALDKNDVINIPDGEVNEDIIEKVVNEIRPVLEGFQNT